MCRAQSAHWQELKEKRKEKRKICIAMCYMRSLTSKVLRLRTSADSLNCCCRACKTFAFCSNFCTANKKNQSHIHRVEAGGEKRVRGSIARPLGYGAENKTRHKHAEREIEARAARNNSQKHREERRQGKRGGEGKK